MIYNKLCSQSKGILAVDESPITIGKRFEPLGIKNTPENRSAYRHMLMTTPHIQQYISGVILHEETINQTINQKPLPHYLQERDIVSGIKLDPGLVLFGPHHEQTTPFNQDRLTNQAQHFYRSGARFAKWRVVYHLSDNTPTPQLVHHNALILAQYAQTVLKEGLIPLLEPEVLAQGDHNAQRCAEVTVAILKAVFDQLAQHHVHANTVLLKTHMVTAGMQHMPPAEATEVAHLTLACLKKTVPHTVPGVFFLSGGLTEIKATSFLKRICHQKTIPWRVSFSYGRALQNSAMQAWAGQHTAKGQQALLQRARANGQATTCQQ